MRKIIVYLATSADGFIARLDGDVGWLDRPKTAGDYGMARFYKSIDTTLMGRKTYDLALSFGQRSYAGKKNYVFTRSPERFTGVPVELVNEDLTAFAARLRAAKGKDIWLVGGGDLIASFLDAGEIDELIIHVVPTIIGEGIPLVSPRTRLVPLKLLATKAYDDGVVRLRYAIARGARRRQGAKKVARRKRR